MEDLSLKNKLMENKIKEIQEYFKDKIIAWDFKYIIKDDEISILIDDKYNFYFFVKWWAVFEFPAFASVEHFMHLSFSHEEQTQIWKIFEKIILENKSESEKEKDLKEFERIKKLYKLI